MAHLPLRPVAFSTLATLLSGPQAGFEILTAVNAALPSHPILGPGTLYRLLRELRLAKLIEPVPAPEAERGEDERRQYHRLTELGRSVVSAEAERLRKTLASAHLLPSPGGG